MGFRLWFLLDIEKMDGDEHIIGIIWKVLGMLCFLLDLAPFLSLYILLTLMLISTFVFRLPWTGCNFVSRTDSQLYTYPRGMRGLRTGAKWSSGFICGHSACFSEFLNISAHGGGALFCLWEHRTPQPWADIYRLYNFMLTFIMLFSFQISVRMYLLHPNLGCSRYIPLALMFTSGLYYIMPQNPLKKSIIYITLNIRFLILVICMISPQRCLNSSKFWFLDILGGSAPSGSISSQSSIIVRIFGIIFSDTPNNEDSNY